MSILHYGISIGGLNIIQNDLVGFWRFDENAGDTVFDYSGNGHNLILGGSPLPTWESTGLFFDIGSYIDSDNNANLMQPTFTVCGIVKIVPSSFDCLIAWNSVGNSPNLQLSRAVTPTLRPAIIFKSTPTTGRDWLQSPNDLHDNNWHFFAFVCPIISQAGIADTVFYVDNVVQTFIATAANSVPDVQNAFRVGSSYATLRSNMRLAALTFHAASFDSSRIHHMYNYLRTIVKPRGIFV